MNSFLKLNAVVLIAALVFASPGPLYAQFDDSSPDEDRMGNFDPGGGLTLDLGSNYGAPSGGPMLGNPSEQRITLELKGVDVLDVLKILSTRSGLNIVAGKNVRGQVTIYLKDVLIYEALDTIISALGLAYEEDQGIIKVMTEKEYEALYGKSFKDRRITKSFKIRHVEPQAIQQVVQQLKGPLGKVILDERTNTLIVSDLPELIEEIENAIRELDEPLVTQVFKLEYANAEDVQEQLQDYVTPESGVLKVDLRSNKIAVTDRAEKVDQIAKLVKEFDIRPPQVLIEAQLVEVQLFDSFRYGIDWEYVRTKLKDVKDVSIQPDLDLDAANATAGGALSTFSIGQTGITGLDNLVISILQSVGKTNTLSAPRITVLNNEEAKLSDATRQPYVTSSTIVSESTSTPDDEIEFVDVGVTLTVVPTISDDNTIVMKLKPEVSVVSSTLEYDTAAGSVSSSIKRTVPIVASQTLETTVIVRSGETLIVGGLIKDSQKKVRRKLPVLGDIPVFGAAFRSDLSDFVKTELVIFLTPYIIDGSATTKEHEKFLDREGEFIDFDKVGGYDFALGQTHSQGPFRQDNKPYWRVEELAVPRYTAPKNVYERAEPYQDHVNEFYGEQGKEHVSRLEFLQVYEKKVGKEVISALGELPELEGKAGRIDLSLIVRRDGALEDVSFVDVGPLQDRKLRRKVLEAIRAVAPFEAFPPSYRAEKEVVDLRFELGV